MPRNGLFADDGRVTDFALYARGRMTTIEGAATTLTARVSTAETDINTLEGNLANEANARIADVDAETLARTTAIASEVTARNAAIAAEASARTAAIGALKLATGGVQSMTFSVGESEQDTYVTFPVGYFTNAPIAVASLAYDASVHGITVSVDNITSSGMTVGMNSTVPALLPADRTLSFNWLALEL